MKPLKLKPKQKLLLYVAIGVIFLFLMERVVFSGLRTKMKDLNKQIKAEEIRLVSGMEIGNKKDELSSIYNQYQSYFKSGEKNLSDRETITVFLKEIEVIAKESGISIMNLTPQDKPQDVNGCKKYIANMRAEGSTEQLYVFLSGIQKSELTIKADKMTISPKDEQAVTLRIEGDLSISML